MTKFRDEWDAHCKALGEPDRVELMLCDMNAILRGKWLPGSEISKLTKGLVCLPLSTYAPNILGREVEETGYGIVAGDPDGQLQPVSGTLVPVPWVDGNIAQVLVEMTDDSGGISALSSRQILARMLDRLAGRNMFPVVATELEFYIVKHRKDAAAAPEPPDRLPDAQNYDLEVLARKSDILDDILGAASAQGLATDTLIAEYGPGQFEINFHHTSDVLAAADTALMFRRLVRAVVANHGFEATFMAKPYADFPGNGMHVHVSLLDGDKRNIFAAEPGVELSPLLGDAVAGALDTMRDLQAIFAPHLNSYRRFQPNSFAPAAPEWGFDNRSAAIRLPEIHGAGARLEHRICGADVNPYLAIAAILGGILHGLETKPKLQRPLGNPKATPQAPLSHDWTTAVDRLSASPLARDILGPDFVGTYETVRRDEIKELTAAIAPIEYSTYLSRL